MERVLAYRAIRRGVQTSLNQLYKAEDFPSNLSTHSLRIWAAQDPDTLQRDQVPIVKPDGSIPYRNGVTPRFLRKVRENGDAWMQKWLTAAVRAQSPFLPPDVHKGIVRRIVCKSNLVKMAREMEIKAEPKRMKDPAVFSRIQQNSVRYGIGKFAAEHSTEETHEWLKSMFQPLIEKACQEKYVLQSTRHDSDKIPGFKKPEASNEPLAEPA